MKSEYDVIVVGARVAGSSLAYQLARTGFEVLLLDENLFPSDTLSMHHVFGNTLGMLKEIGVYDRLLATGAPLYRRARFSLEGAEIAGEFPGGEEESSCLSVKRIHFDHILLDQAKSQPGVTLLEGFSVIGVIRENGAVTGVIGQHRDGSAVSFAAKLVVGADGRLSSIREMVGSVQKKAVPTDYAHFVAYMADFKQEDGPQAEYYRWQGNSASVFPTSDNLHVVGVTFPLQNSSWMSRFAMHPESAFRSLLEEGFSHTSLPARFDGAVFSGLVRGMHGFDNDWHQGTGKGWALVGDALSFKDPGMAQGMHDALYSSLLLADILADYHPDNWMPGWELIASVYESALEKKWMSRFKLACRVGRYMPVTPQGAAVFRMIAEDREATRVFLGACSGVYEPEDMDREVSRLLSALS
jgi:flavin-dependent dehydrogenase